MNLAVHPTPHEAQSQEILDEQLVGNLPASDQGERDLHASPGLEAQEPVDDAGDGIGNDLPIALRAMGAAHSSEQQAQEVVYLRSRPHGRTTRLGRVSLLDGHRRGEALDGVDVGLLQPVHELLGVAGQGLDVAPLAGRE